jgi:biotin-dependent carboxylase-like uncharacterized protein
MTSVLKVIQPGIHTTVQDLGRKGFQDAGVPVAGPLDRDSLRLANALVGNPLETAALELVLQGPALEVQADSVRVALAGCQGALEVGGEQARTVPAGQSVRLMRGETVRVAQLGDAACAYLAVEGGFDLTPVLGSVATYVRGGMGGLNGTPLKRDMLLPLRQTQVEERPELGLTEAQDLAFDAPIRVVLGPQDDFFSEAGIATFLSGEYTVTPQSDRMGFRMDGPALEHSKGYNIVSDGIVSGSIQVPGSGMPIVLLADAQTTGGYPKIATVISADLPVLGRRRPGRKVRFAAVTVQEAEQLRRAQEVELARTIETLREVNAEVTIDLGALYRTNLISGVVSHHGSSSAG